jgi:DNA-binding XRE family transcriptional regulator
MMQALDNPWAEKIGHTVHNPGMAPGASDFKKAFLDRTAKLREGWGGSQADMAEALGIRTSNYEKYETRTPLPHYLIPRFAQIVEVEISFLFTGRARLRRSGTPAPATLTKRGRNRSLSAKKS